MQKIMVLAAIPHSLRSDQEIREIEGAIRRAERRDLFEVQIRTAVRRQDIRRAIAEEHPQIVHFCGHGMEDGSLVLEDNEGHHKPISPESLAALFELHTEYVKCVLLNACYSEIPAKAISQYINYVIGMNQRIEDRAAIIFAQGFYDGLGYENLDSQNIIQRAFKEGIAAIKMENLLQGSIPVLRKRSNQQDRRECEESVVRTSKPPIWNRIPWEYVRSLAIIISIGIVLIVICFILNSRQTQFSNVKDVPSGTFRYTGTTTWSSLRCADGKNGIDTRIHFRSDQSKFKPIYALPEDIDPKLKNTPPDSSLAIKLLIEHDKEVAFAMSSRNFEEEDRKRAKDKGFDLEAIPVAQDVTAIAVNRSLNIKDISGLSLHELMDIYTSHTQNWHNLRSSHLKITPYIHKAEKKREYPFQKEVLKGQRFGSTVKDVPNTAVGIEKVSNEPGAIYLAPAALIYRESRVQLMPIVGDHHKPVFPFKSNTFNPQKICENSKSEDDSPVPLDPEYPKKLQKELVYVIVKHYEDNTNPNEMAGRAYANLLLTDEGQRIMRQMGFQRYNSK